MGGTFYRGLSGGQKRRLSVGFQLLSRPDLLVLDEPLSGLDSYAAERVAAHLRDIAAAGGTAVVASIHSPSVEVYGMAHKLCLLAAGRVVYFGPTASAGAYFTARGCTLPPGRSVPEALLRLTNPDFGGRAAVARLADAWATSAEREALILEGQAAATAAAPTVGWAAPKAPSPYALSWVGQTALLAKRVAIDAFRNPTVIWLRAAMYVALAILIGLAWLRVPTSADRIQDLLGALFFSQAFFVFMSIAGLPSHLEEKSISTAQRASGWYSKSAYVVGHGLVEAAFLLLLSIVLPYPDMGDGGSQSCNNPPSLLNCRDVDQPGRSRVLHPPCGLHGAIPVGGSDSQCFHLWVYDGGTRIFTRVANLGPLRWARWLSLHGYALGGFVANEFSGRVYAAAPGALPSFPTAVAGDTVVAALELPSTNRAVCVGVLVGMAVLLRVAAWGWIASFHRGKK